MLLPGQPAPLFVAPSTSNAQYAFHTVGGRYVVLCFLGSAADPYSRGVVDGYLRARPVFDDVKACFFGVSIDPADASAARLRQVLPGYRYFWDFERGLGRLYGVDSDAYRACSIVLDRRLRVLAIVPFEPGVTPDAHVETVVRIIDEQCAADAAAAGDAYAPVLVVPRVLEPAFCATLIRYFHAHEPAESGFMRERHGQTVQVFDHSLKRRQDVSIVDEALRVECRQRLVDRLKPEVFKAFQFTATYAERYIVSRYEGAQGGFFGAHRDNTTKGTAHRRFAVTINLNTGDYEGGALRFPEFGSRTYVAPLGGAVVFSCSLLHEATPVTSGTRYAFLPFLYDDAAARIREENLPFVEPEAR